MSYGITSKSQIIDIATIKAGISKYKAALSDFESCGNAVIQAGNTCSAEALSVDSSSMQYPIGEVGRAISKLKSEYSGYADEVLSKATQVYNEQLSEYNAYVEEQRRKEEQRRLQQQQQSSM